MLGATFQSVPESDVELFEFGEKQWSRKTATGMMDKSACYLITIGG